MKRDMKITSISCHSCMKKIGNQERQFEGEIDVSPTARHFLGVVGTEPQKYWTCDTTLHGFWLWCGRPGDPEKS